MMTAKILDYDAFRHRINEYRRKNLKVVLCYGVFGVLHIGHIRYLKEAKQFGDVVVVVLSAEQGIRDTGKHEFNASRAEALAHLHWIDLITVNIYDNFKEMIQEIRPNVFARGFEHIHADQKFEIETQEEIFLRKIGIRYEIIRGDRFSSTAKINKFYATFSDEVVDYLALFRQRYAGVDLLAPLDRIEQLKVLVIGDSILDEYQYCTALGKSSKDPTLVLKYRSKDLFPGGVLAVANNIAGFVNDVDLLTVLGEQDSHEGYIRGALRPNINPKFIFKRNAPTLIKRRFIDGYSMQKLLELYIMDDSYLEEDLDLRFKDMLDRKLPGYDIVVVTDYGHGALSKNIIEYLSAKAGFLAVNTQSNAGNHGFNTISKYPRADFVSLAEHEIRLETRDMVGRVVPMMKTLVAKLACRKFVVTLGKSGCMVIDNRNALVQVPTFARNVVDRVGAGDAFFAVTACLAKLNVPSEILGFIGNVVGSLSVEIMGNQKSIGKNDVQTNIQRLLDL